jgi:hypothetical protein
MDSLHRDEFAEYFHDSQHATVVQVWLEATASMTEEEFRSDVKRLAELIEREKLHNVLVDVARMAYRPRGL